MLGNHINYFVIHAAYFNSYFVKIRYISKAKTSYSLNIFTCYITSPQGKRF